MNLTPWYPPHIKPVRVGVYETDSETHGGPCHQYWNGYVWGYCAAKIKEAFEIGGYISWHQSPSWRGLAHPPEKRA